VNTDIPALFKRWRKPLRQWLSHRSGIRTVDLDDIAQEVFVRLLKYSDDTAISNPQGYLFRIAANCANEWQERAVNSKEHMPVETLSEGWEEMIDRCTPEACVAVEQARQRQKEAVDKLPRRQRKVLLLHINEGLTYKQIALRERITYRIVLRDLTRAYATLRANWYE
jgi:RNA polymerase sigma factor (sigma-70 family)